MRGTIVVVNDQGSRYAGGETVDFDRGDVVAFGLHGRYGDFVTRYQVRLASGAEVMLVGADQTKQELAWLRSLARATPRPAVSRDAPLADAWIDLPAPLADF